jgi:hypothetical protein
MGKKGKKKRKAAVVNVDEFNRRLDALRKRAKKAAKGKGGAKSAAARERWIKLQDGGFKKSCCGKAVTKACSSCPRHAADLVLKPLKA